MAIGSFTVGLDPESFPSWDYRLLLMRDFPVLLSLDVGRWPNLVTYMLLCLLFLFLFL